MPPRPQKSAPKAPEGRKPSADIKHAYIGSTDLSGIVPVFVVFPPRSGASSASSDTVLSFDLSLKGSTPFANISLRDKVKTEVLLETVTNRAFAKVSPEAAVSFIMSAVARCGSDSVPKEIQPFSKYQRDPLPTLEALAKSGEGLGVATESATADVMAELLDSGPEYDHIELGSYLAASRVVPPSSYSLRTTWARTEVDRWISTAQMLLGMSPTFLADVNAMAAHMALFHFWRDEHSAARLMATAAQQTVAKTHPLAAALLRRCFAGITIVA